MYHPSCVSQGLRKTRISCRWLKQRDSKLDAEMCKDKQWWEYNTSLRDQEIEGK